MREGDPGPSMFSTGSCALVTSCAVPGLWCRPWAPSMRRPSLSRADVAAPGWPGVHPGSVTASRSSCERSGCHPSIRTLVGTTVPGARWDPCSPGELPILRAISGDPRRRSQSPRTRHRSRLTSTLVLARGGARRQRPLLLPQAAGTPASASTRTAADQCRVRARGCSGRR
jgi:hypothetical protein